MKWQASENTQPKFVHLLTLKGLLSKFWEHVMVFFHILGERLAVHFVLMTYIWESKQETSLALELFQPLCAFASRESSFLQKPSTSENKSLESERYMGGFAYGLKDVFVGVGWRNKMLNWRLSTTEIVECIYRDKRNERKVAHFKFVAKKEKQKWTELEISFQRKFPLFLLNILPPTSRQQAHVYWSKITTHLLTCLRAFRPLIVFTQSVSISLIFLAGL